MAQTSSSPNLITSKTAGILGPIKSGDVVLLGTWGTNQTTNLPEILFLGPLLSGLDSKEKCTPPFFVFTPSATKDIGTYAIETVTKDPLTGVTTVMFTNTDTQNVLSTKNIDNQLALIEDVGVSTQFTLEQSTYTSMATSKNDVVALSFVNYQFKVKGEPIVVCNTFCCCGTEVCESPFGDPPIFLVPLSWYYDCPTGKKSTSKLGSICVAECAAQSLISGPKVLACGSDKNGKGPCGNLPLLGFTDSIDCKNGYRYEYCPVGTNCMGTCKSACPNENQVCTFQKRGDGGIYTCIGPTGPNGPTGANGVTGADGSFCVFPSDCISGRCVGNVCVAKSKSKEKDILIIAGIMVGIIVIGIIIYTIFAFRRSDKT